MRTWGRCIQSTGILLDRTGTVPFAANRKVPEGILRKMVVNLSKVGSRCFPQVYAVVKDMEQDSGLLPLEPMNGMAITDDEGGAESDDCGDEDVSDNGDVDDNNGNFACANMHCKRTAKARIALCKRVAVLERRRRVGYTIDMSINLGNASHYDVHNASRGFSVWTEEVPGLGANWFFVLPNVHGKKPDGTEFHGMAVKLGHGMDTGDGPDPMVGVEAVDIGKESVVGSPADRLLVACFLRCCNKVTPT